jgi:hypothetical protein
VTALGASLSSAKPALSIQALLDDARRDLYAKIAEADPEGLHEWEISLETDPEDELQLRLTATPRLRPVPLTLDDAHEEPR